ncbi:ribosome recycling factor [Gemella sp. GH3]|uniref:ribosome recycling factor n=1 Tax=unclassified Gemella TaxID=2624949 RepID=UPI0015D0406D|nr:MULTISPECIES: ribosome recycling factor [unclassified Gemella]MBF0713254.1 ribosome recycling factor [Gemella sp. GH3.1]NYS50206.1 ribosome recycling factor [Gemella sp. GH3]
MPEQILLSLEEKMTKAISSLRRELASIRAGKANASVLDRLNVEYYGVPTPINQVAGISVPEPKMLVISPYEKSLLKEIEKAIQSSDLGLNPANDGTVIRIVFPALTEERRKELAKQVGKESENSKVAVRNVRRDAMDSIKKLEKASQITEDDLKGYSDDIQKATDKFIAEIDKITKEKQEELMSV